MQSHHLFKLATQALPGGVSSPVRAFKQIDREPFFVKCGQGAYLEDMDGKRYIDYVASWGPLIVGHAHPYIREQVVAALDKGFSFGAPTEVEVLLAQAIARHLPSIERIRFVNSGTEAAMSAIRVARGFTNRSKILKFSGCYHGHADSLLVAAGSGGLTYNLPNSAGVPQEMVAHTLIAPYNDLEQVQQLFSQHDAEIAAIIVEPVAGNMNCVLPSPGFLSGLRAICDQYGSLLIFDEVITGFRVALGGAQSHFGVQPDLTVLGKIIGGGFPAAAFGGRREVMEKLAPLGPVYQAGTLSGNPIAMTAGLATLTLLEAPDFYDSLTAKTEKLVSGIQASADHYHIPLKTVSIGGMFGLFFTEAEHIQNEADVLQCNQEHFKRFFLHMLEQGVYFAPSAYEIGFMSQAHTEQEIANTLRVAEKVFSTFFKDDPACSVSSAVAQA